MVTTTAAPTTAGVKSKPKLEDQAAIAALYVTKSASAPKLDQEYLDSNNRLSSAGAAASLKYANPQDLPSFPSYGLRRDDSAAGAAASMGWANQKPFEHWKPNPSASASAAAVTAKDYKMKPLWQPEQSSSGARAAVLAHKDNGKVEVWKPEATSWGNSAANQAFRKYPTSAISPPVDYGYSWTGKQGSLLAATGAMSTRKRAESTPIPPPAETYPDEKNAAGNALKAAVSVHKRKPSDTVGGAVPFTNMPKEMFTSNPPVAPEVEEMNRQNTIRASAVAMAKSMYSQQQRSIDAANNAHSGARAAHGRPSSASSDDPQPMYLGNVQEAARKLAQERLAKLHDEHTRNREFRDYYGNSKPPSRLSIRNRTRRRASSDGTYDEDREQSNKIRAQMSIFSSNLSQVDEQKRTKDREALIAAAQRNVTKSLKGMDEKVFADTGKVAPSLLSEWELKAHAAAQAKSENRMENYGKVNIGGGRFINQSEIDLVASRNVQPVLDEINEKAQIERERQAAIKAEQLERERKAYEARLRDKEAKEINKKLKQQDKEEEKARKAEAKATKAEEKRAVDEEKRTADHEKRKSSKFFGIGSSTSAAAPTEKREETGAIESESAAVARESESKASPSSGPPRPVVPVDTIRTSMEDQASLRMRENANAANPEENTPTSPSSPKEGNKVKTWLKSRLSKRQSKNPKSSPQKPPTSEPTTGEVETKRQSFIGGAALSGISSRNSSASSIGPESSSIRDVALAGRSKNDEREDSSEDERPTKRDKRQSEISALSSKKDTDDDEEFLEAHDNFNEDLIQKPAFGSEEKASSTRDSKFKEEI